MKTDDDLQAYLDGLRSHGNRSRAAREAGMSLQTVKKRRQRDEEFAEAEDLALEEAADALEEEARRRAHDGIVKAVFHNGKRVDDGEVIQYSDALLAKLLDGALPHKYAQRVKSEVTGADGGPIRIGDETETSARIAAILEAARHRKANAVDESDPLLQ